MFKMEQSINPLILYNNKNFQNQNAVAIFGKN